MERPHWKRLIHPIWIKRPPRGLWGGPRPYPSACEPGSDIANLSLMGYDPLNYHTGRAPLEAVSMGIRLKDKDVAFRCNLVYLDHQGNDVVTMGSYSAGHISTEEAGILINDLKGFLARPDLSFYPGVSYRHILVWSGADPSAKTKPPHDLSGQDVMAYLNSKGELEPIVDLMRRTWPFLRRHPINQNRLEQVWFRPTPFGCGVRENPRPCLLSGKDSAFRGEWFPRWIF